jgi:hypothetical protein
MNLEIQEKKTNKKILLVKHIITVAKELNDIADHNNYKEYKIKLSYQSFDNYVQFNIDILRNNKTFVDKLNFKFDTIEKGLQIFDELQNFFIDKFDINFSSVSATGHTIKSSYNLELKKCFYNEKEREHSLILNEKCWNEVINVNAHKKKILSKI